MISLVLYHCVRVCVVCVQVKEEAPQVRSSDTFHVDPAGLVTLTTPNRLSTIGVRAIPLPQGETCTHTELLHLSFTCVHTVYCRFMLASSVELMLHFKIARLPRGHPAFGGQHGADSHSGAAEHVSERGEACGRQHQDSGVPHWTQSPAGEPAAGKEVEERCRAYLVLWASEVW